MVDLHNGIFLEDKGTLLKWGSKMKSSAKKVPCKIENQGDRTIYNWGKHKILNGLELNLKTMFWNFGKERWFRKFNSIEFWAIGDEIAESEFDRISKHLINQFGQPHIKDSRDDDKSVKWVFGKIQLHVYFFEQHCYKLHFTISKKS